MQYVIPFRHFPSTTDLFAPVKELSDREEWRIDSIFIKPMSL